MATRIRKKKIVPQTIPLFPILWKVRARSIHRRSRADTGQLGVWIALAVREEDVRANWPHMVPSGEWKIETVIPSGATWARVF